MQTNKNKIMEKEKYIQDADAWIDDSGTKLTEIRNDRKAATIKLAELENSCEDQKCKIANLTEDEKKLLLEKRQKEHSLAEARKKLEDLIHEDKLNALISKQPTFAEALQAQIDVFAENRLQGLVFGEEKTDTKKIAEGILRRMDSLGDFSGNTYVWRDAKADYQDKLKQICDAKLKGENITSIFAESRFSKIQDVLRKQETLLFR